MSFVTEALIISGVSLDLVGATVLSHAHNAESALELREEIGARMSAHSARRMLSLPTRGYSEKRVGFLIGLRPRVVPDGAGTEFFRKASW